jgi:threonine dehydrogenase-like Zn-dependent dehydrogenase
MRAARYYGKEDVRIEHHVAPPPQQLGEGQVRVRPAFVGICGTGKIVYITKELIYN